MPGIPTILDFRRLGGFLIAECESASIIALAYRNRASRLGILSLIQRRVRRLDRRQRSTSLRLTKSDSAMVKHAYSCRPKFIAANELDINY